MDDGRIETENMGNAIVEQAHEDYLEALLLETKAIRMLEKAAKLKQSVLSFYGSKWYYSLTQVDPAILLETARKQADYINWQKWHQCEYCKYECVHREPRVNWKLWVDGKRVCIYDRERKKKN